MSLYNLLHGVNPISPLLLKMLDIDQPDGKWQSGRFRDIYLNEDGTRILLYTRNGGGNRECWHGDDWYANKECKHETRTELVDEVVEATEEEAKSHPEWKPRNVFIGTKRQYETGRKVNEEQYRCLEPSSPECSCAGCTIEHRLPKHPNYIGDYDDDFDCTYATIEFSVPKEYENLARALATGEKPKSVSEKFTDTIAALEKKTPDELRADEKMKPLIQILEQIDKGESTSQAS